MSNTKGTDWNTKLTDWIFRFIISEKIPLLNQIENSHNIEFEIEEIQNGNNSKYLTGFNVRINNSPLDEAETRSRIIARNLKNILIIKSGIPIDVNLKNYTSMPKQGELQHIMTSLTLRWKIEGGIKELDLKNPDIQSVLYLSEIDSLKYQYLSKGIFHYYNKNPAESIRELFRVIENNSKFPNYARYQVLRHLFSHEPPYHHNTISQFLKEFNNNDFDYNKFDPSNNIIIIDMESGKTKSLLNNIASNLISELRKELKIEK